MIVYFSLCFVADIWVLGSWASSSSAGHVVQGMPEKTEARVFLPGVPFLMEASIELEKSTQMYRDCDPVTSDVVSIYPGRGAMASNTV